MACCDHRATHGPCLANTTNSIDERLAAIFQEKGDASDLALDGRLFQDEKEEVSLADLIRSAAVDFDPTATTIPESAVLAEWEQSLRNRLATAASAFTLARGTHQPATPNPQPAPPNSQSITSLRAELADLYALIMTSSAPSEHSDTTTTPSSPPLETENLKLESSNIIPFPPQRPHKPISHPRHLTELLTF